MGDMDTVTKTRKTVQSLFESLWLPPAKPFNFQLDGTFPKSLWTFVLPLATSQIFSFGHELPRIELFINVIFHPRLYEMGQRTSPPMHFFQPHPAMSPHRHHRRHLINVKRASDHKATFSPSKSTP